MIFLHRLIFENGINAPIDGLNTSVSTHTPIASAATAVPTFNGTAILLIVTDLSLSTPLITTRTHF